MRMGFLWFCLFFIFVCTLLGIWQVHRYHFKKALLMTYQKHASQAAVPFLKLLKSQEDVQFQHVKVRGYYVNDAMILIQNRFYHGQLGYEVITPLRIPGQATFLLVDRGWVAKPPTAPLPTIEGVVAPQQITGTLKLLNEYQFILGKNIFDTESLPIVVQKIDIQELNQLTHLSFYPFILRLDPSNQNGFQREWTITTIPPERHMAYAVQWFALSVVLCVGYLSYYRRQRVRYEE